MIFKFEEWLQQAREIDSDSKDLYKESILCFRAGAYHAAFLICYVGNEEKCLVSVNKKPKQPKIIESVGRN